LPFSAPASGLQRREFLKIRKRCDFSTVITTLTLSKRFFDLFVRHIEIIIIKGVFFKTKNARKKSQGERWRNHVIRGLGRLITRALRFSPVEETVDHF